MATVPNKGMSTPIDKKLSSPNRKVSASPVKTTTPLYTGELVINTEDGSLWYATDKTDTGWVAASARI